MDFEISDLEILDAENSLKSDNTQKSTGHQQANSIILNELHKEKLFHFKILSIKEAFINLIKLESMTTETK